MENNLDLDQNLCPEELKRNNAKETIIEKMYDRCSEVLVDERVSTAVAHFLKVKIEERFTRNMSFHKFPSIYSQVESFEEEILSDVESAYEGIEKVRPSIISRQMKLLIEWNKDDIIKTLA